MKTSLTIAVIFLVSLSSAALAGATMFTCREAVFANNGSYAGTIKPDGLTITIQTIRSNKVKINMSGSDNMRHFRARVVMPSPREQGFAGGLEQRRFDFEFAVLPPFLEINEGKSYFAGYLNLKEMEDHLMFCDLKLIDLFTQR